MVEESKDSTKRSSEIAMSNTNSGPNTRLPQYTLKHDGDYLFVIHISGSPGSSFNAAVELEMQGMSSEFFLINAETTIYFMN